MSRHFHGPVYFFNTFWSMHFSVNLEAQAPSLGSFKVQERKKETLTFKNAGFRSVDWFVGLKICSKFEPKSF